MNVKETKLKDCFVLEPRIFQDNRGYFFESYNSDAFIKSIGESIQFVQDNESYSTRGTLRGLHYQRGEFAQAKLVRVIKGVVLDVALDLRKHSKTFGDYVIVELSEDNKKQLFVPRGFAHGFIVLSETAIFSYKCDNYYNKEAEAGIIYNDPKLAIDWRLKNSEIILSSKDKELPLLENALL